MEIVIDDEILNIVHKSIQQDVKMLASGSHLMFTAFKKPIPLMRNLISLMGNNFEIQDIIFSKNPKIQSIVIQLYDLIVHDDPSQKIFHEFIVENIININIDKSIEKEDMRDLMINVIKCFSSHDFSDCKNKLIQDMAEEVINTQLYPSILKGKIDKYFDEKKSEGMLIIDKEFFLTIMGESIFFIQSLTDLIGLEFFKQTQIVIDPKIEEFINVHNKVKAAKGGIKKAQSARELMQPIKDRVLSLYCTPSLANRERWRSRNEFAQYFCMNYNRSIADESKWLKESTVKNWVKEFLESE